MARRATGHTQVNSKSVQISAGHKQVSCRKKEHRQSLPKVGELVQRKLFIVYGRLEHEPHGQGLGNC